MLPKRETVMRHTCTFEKACEEVGIDHDLLRRFVGEHWVEPSTVSEEPLFDDEDLARARLILILRSEFRVNDEAIPVILHLLDQLYALRELLRRAA